MPFLESLSHFHCWSCSAEGGACKDLRPQAGALWWACPFWGSLECTCVTGPTQAPPTPYSATSLSLSSGGSSRLLHQQGLVLLDLGDSVVPLVITSQAWPGPEAPRDSLAAVFLCAVGSEGPSGGSALGKQRALHFSGSPAAPEGGKMTSLRARRREAV